MAERTREHAACIRDGMLLVFIALGVGCVATPRAAEPVREHWVPGYVFGIWGKSELDARDDCPSTGVARLRIGPTLPTLLVSFATLGMYTPREVVVHCRAPR
ncbi:MAG TPA: hypothetical protein VHV51_23375 [Polyangiaceae bacterium]|jgi:hypothetical protein|nr:hypothetical protein [Polyangiaceae bacterium]